MADKLLISQKRICTCEQSKQMNWYNNKLVVIGKFKETSRFKVSKNNIIFKILFLITKLTLF